MTSKKPMLVPAEAQPQAQSEPLGDVQSEPEPEVVVEPVPVPPPPPMPAASITRGPDGWHLVKRGGWEVSVAPDGMVMLPRHVHPDHEDEFLAAMSSACQLGRSVREGNVEAARNDDRSPAKRMMITEGQLPPGAVRMPIATGANSPAARASIGRQSPRLRPQHGAQPAGTYAAPQSRVPTPPRLPNRSQ